MRKALIAIIAAVILIQIFLAIRFFGFLTGDDVEVLLEASRRATGLDYQPWDVRNLFVPDVVVAPFVFLGGLRAAVIPFIALSALTIWLVYRLALQWSGDQRAAMAASLLFAFHWIPLGFGSTVYPRNLAMTCVVAAAVIVDRFPFAAGALAGLAFADRFSEIIFIIPLGIAFKAAASRRTPKAAALILGAIVSITIAVGLYDWITYGSPFSSVIKFARLTLVEPDFASRVKYQSPLWYLYNLVRWCAPTLLPLLYFARKSMRWSFIVIPLLAFSIVRHKELRYLQVMIPFLAVAAGIGFAVLYQRSRKWAAALLVISLIWNLHGLRYFARKSMPAVMAAHAILANPKIKVLVVSQLWAYGDRLYFDKKLSARDVGTPPRDLDRNLDGADAAALYETDLDHPELAAALQRHHFVAWGTFRDGPARAVVVFTSASGTSDRVRR
jgi:glycosyl transferase family 22 (putative mannosyltransferase)